MFLRYSAKVLIIRDGKILLLTKHLNDDYLVLPGGGQIPGETLEETAERECMEELGAVVEVRDLAYIREYREWNHEFKGQNPGYHQVNVVFNCHLISLNPEKAHEIDTNQTGTMWADLATLVELPLYPKVISTLFDREGYVGPRYLGDVN